jgi:lipoprotein NlpD
MVRLRVVALSLLCGLTGCSHFRNQEAAPVVSIDARHPTMAGFHTVSPGETLYAIAWQYGHDYRDLAQQNHIVPPYRIYPGQKITLKGQYKVTKRKPIQIATLPKTSSKLDNPKSEAIKVTALKPVQIVSSGGWQWPVKGKILKTFSKHDHTFSKGIDISGTLGTPVCAAKEGKVVYSGEGLRGYGQLIIIKHNDTFLSAYAHNQGLLVKEGDSIKQGQPIAYMGQTDADRVKLHFEIRKNGQPVDPLQFLAKQTA